MEDFLKNLTDSAKEAAEKAGEKFNELKDAASEKFADLSEKAEALAAEAQKEAAEKLAEAQAAKDKIAAHEGGALGFLSDKAKEIMGDIQEGAADALESGKDFWEKAKDYVSGEDKNDAPAA
ncbi:MAG: hypothetical protein WCR52_22435 [Bacteroidota bacterium]|uniref:hypothetical protein n=1 Tax=Runella sp. TaxID=1960881 RepID=UPI003015D350